jgi:hypothetical protein
MIKKTFKILLILIITYSCSSNVEKDSRHNKKGIDNFLVKELGAGYYYKFNSDSSLILFANYFCNSTFPNSRYLKFFVSLAQKDSIVYGDSVLNGCVKWIKRNKLEVTLFPEVEREKKVKVNTSYVVDVLTKKKIFK